MKVGALTKMKQVSDAFVVEYAKQLSETSRYDASALEMVMRNSLSSLDEAGIRLWMPQIMDTADKLGIGLFVAAEIMTSGTARDFEKYAQTPLAEAAKKLRAQLEALPKEGAMALEAVRAMARTVEAYGPPRSRPRRALDWLKRRITRS